MLPLSNYSTLTVYTEDIIISYSFSFDSVQFDIKIISSWLSSHLLMIIPNNSKYMIITCKSPRHPVFPCTGFNSTPLKLVPSFTSLGVTFTSNLSRSLYISKVCTKSRKTIGIIYHKLYYHLSTHTLLRHYTALVLPYLTYCSTSWAPLLLLLNLLNESSTLH